MEETEAVNARFEKFLKEFEGLEEQVQALLKTNSLLELSDQISLSEKAKLNVALTYLLNSLYYIYMKINGRSFECHKINDEMELIKKYVQKVQEVILIQEERRKNPFIVNQPAAERMIRSYLGNFEDKNFEPDLPNAKNTVQLNQDNNSLELEKLEAGLQKTQSTKKSQKLHKGSLLPSDNLMTWRANLDKILK